MEGRTGRTMMADEFQAVTKLWISTNLKIHRSLKLRKFVNPSFHFFFLRIHSRLKNKCIEKMINYSWLSPTFRIHLGCVLSSGIHAIQVHKLKFVNEHLQFINP